MVEKKEENTGFPSASSPTMSNIPSEVFLTFRDAHLYPRSLLTWPDSIHSFGAAEGRETSRHQQISFLLLEQAANHACINASARCSDGGKKTRKSLFLIDFRGEGLQTIAIIPRKLSRTRQSVFGKHGGPTGDL